MTTPAAQPSYDGQAPVIGGFAGRGKSSAVMLMVHQLAATGEVITFIDGRKPRPSRPILTQFSAGGLSAPIDAGQVPAPGPGGPAQSPAQPGEQMAPDAGSWWVITRGEFDDRANLAIFCGTQAQADILVAQLNQTRRDVDPFGVERVGARYDAEQIAPITAAADLAPGEGPGR